VSSSSNSPERCARNSRFGNVRCESERTLTAVRLDVQVASPRRGERPPGGEMLRRLRFRGFQYWSTQLRSSFSKTQDSARRGEAPSLLVFFTLFWSHAAPHEPCEQLQ
jgi:hypothetical protein